MINFSIRHSFFNYQTFIKLTRYTLSLLVIDLIKQKNIKILVHIKF